MDADVETVEAGEESAIDLSIEGDEVIRVSGQIAAGAEPLLWVQQVAEPAAFVRTALIEALERAGVSVAASPTGSNPTDDLPGDYAAERQVSELVSRPFSEYAELIFKVSHNLGANLLVALLAAEAGSTDIVDGFDPGVPRDSRRRDERGVALGRQRRGARGLHHASRDGRTPVVLA